MRVLLSVVMMATATVGLSHSGGASAPRPQAGRSGYPLIMHLRPVPPPLVTAFVFDERRLEAPDPVLPDAVLDVHRMHGYNAFRAHDL